MSLSKTSNRWFLVGSLVGTASIVAGWLIYQRRQRLSKGLQIVKKLRQIIDRQLCFGRPCTTTVVVSSVDEWNAIEERFLQTVDATRIMGLDCEWLTEGTTTGKVALLQMALSDGFCVLVRTCRLKKFPESLKQILARYDVIKLGVAVGEDGKKLFADFGAEVNGTVDLRHLVQRYCPGRSPKLGLQSLASTFLGVQLDKDWRIRSSSWEDDTLSPAHIKYASNDGLVAINIALVISLEKLVEYSTSKNEFDDLVSFTRSLCLPYAGVGFKSKWSNNSTNHRTNPNKNAGNGGIPSVKPRNKHCVRKTPLYHNATLEAPDGALLCVCDIKKARWYIEKDLGTLVQEDPLRVRLKFEPSGRPEGPAGEYYLTIKDNVCVVCGKTESYLRKYIVPHEYRKFFPEIMRDHQSHDILLMCTECHQLSNMHDMSLRRELAVKCNAPIGSDDDIKYHEINGRKTLRSAARAILKDHSNKIPKERRAELEQCLKDYYKVEVLDKTILEDAANLDPNVLNESYAPHGKKVVEYFIENEGIIPLEKMWRENFLEKMAPRFLPPLWSVDHQKQRLDTRAAENRIDPNDYSIANEGQRKNTF